MEDDILKKICKDSKLRRAVTRRSHFWFFHLFFPHYTEHETALFQREMFSLTEEQEIKFSVVMAFRGSGKSTIMNLSYALWSILGIQKKKFVLIVSKTQSQSKTHFLNIRRELEGNELLSKDLGPFDVDENTWGMNSIVLRQLNAKITAVSHEQSIRGLRHGTYRPDLIICDDIEDSNSVLLKENRDATYQWLMSEVIPAGDDRTKIIVLGNLLHEDSLLMRLRKDILEKRIDGSFRAYPLLDNNDQILWPGKYPTMVEIKKLKRSNPDIEIWEKEYLLCYNADRICPILDAIEKKDDKENGEDALPVQILGDYKISAPKISFSVFNSLIEEIDKRGGKESAV